MVNDFARDQMATLANRLIEALPANIRVSRREKGVEERGNRFRIRMVSSMGILILM